MTRKRSACVILTLGAALAGCTRQAPDPCDASSWDDQECQTSIRQHGYYSRGTFIPRSYVYDYPYYYSRYGSYVAGGGRVSRAPSGSYSSSPSRGISRGGFGSTAAGHGGGE